MIRQKIPKAFALAFVLATVPLTAVGESGNVIVIKNFDYRPMELTVAAGSSVTWRNDDEEPHTVTSDIGLFRSGALDGGQSYSFKFDKPGTYRYICSVHPRMVGTIVVK